MSAWPKAPAGAALHGPAGEFVQRTAPHTEADPMALLAQFLVAFGAAAGRHVHYAVEATRHHLNEFVILVGPSGKGRKGSSWDHVDALLTEVDRDFSERCVSSGLSSGEGLIWEVRDGDGGEGDQAGGRDKRRLVLESEFAQVLKVLAREGNTLSPVIRNAWDAKTLQTIAKNTPVRARDAHIAIVGHITKDELLRFISATELANGFFNRFLVIAVQRSQELPFGGRLAGDDLKRVRDATLTALRFAALPRQLTFDPQARERWIDVYGPLSRGEQGLLGAATRRAEAHVVHLRDAGLTRAHPPAPPRSRSGGLALQRRLRALDLRRQPRRPDRRRDLGTRQRPPRRRHADRGPRPLQPQQEGPRDRPGADRARRGRPPATHDHRRRPRPPRRDLAASSPRCCVAKHDAAPPAPSRRGPAAPP